MGRPCRGVHVRLSSCTALGRAGSLVQQRPAVGHAQLQDRVSPGSGIGPIPTLGGLVRCIARSSQSLTTRCRRWRRRSACWPGHVHSPRNGCRSRRSVHERRHGWACSRLWRRRPEQGGCFAAGRQVGAHKQETQRCHSRVLGAEVLQKRLEDGSRVRGRTALRG